MGMTFSLRLALVVRMGPMASKKFLLLLLGTYLVGGQSGSDMLSDLQTTPRYVWSGTYLITRSLLIRNPLTRIHYIDPRSPGELNAR